MEELRKQLFNLAILYGLKRCSDVLDSLRDEVRAHGQFLMGEYDVVEKAQIIVTPIETSTEPEETVKKVRKPRKKKVVEENQVVNEAQPISVVVSQEPLVCSIEEIKPKEPTVEQQPAKGNVKKRWQREQESAKRLELQSQGIFKQDVLTLENVTAWMKSGRSYAVIARESVGCTEEEVSKFCKKHNIRRD
jgi:hypothetical protein